MHVGMGTFFQNPGRARSDADVWRQGLELAGAAEPLGFDSVWSAEHHFTDYHMCPNVAQFLTWVASRTQRVQLGSMVMVLPWHDPVRLAEEVSVLDHMSGGRVLLGLGRGLGRVEFDGFRLEMGESRRRFTEYADAILSALETGEMAYDGELYHQPRVEIRPAPLASFRGRVYASAISPETSRILAELGVGMMIIAQKPWETVEADVADDFCRFLAGLQVWGTPAAVAEQLRENVRRIDGAGVVGVFNYAGMPDDVAMANIGLFAKSVLPVLNGIDTGPPVGRPVTAAAR